MANSSDQKQEKKEALVNVEILKTLADVHEKYEEYLRLTSYVTDKAQDYPRENFRDVNYPLSIVIR